MIGFDERRSLFRMTMRVECACELSAGESGEILAGSVKDLSGGGALIWCERDLARGTPIEVTIPAANGSASPLMASGVVVRSTPAPVAGSYALACEFHTVS